MSSHVEKLKFYYHFTDIGECGGKLSAGQKQSVAVIRALIQDPRVIILDEATSKLDVDAEQAVSYKHKPNRET